MNAAAKQQGKREMKNGKRKTKETEKKNKIVHRKKLSEIVLINK